jgi:hypothetical protein
MSKPGFHYAQIDNSPALQSLLKFLEERGNMGATGAEIWDQCQILNPGTWCSMLRHNGFEIECKFEAMTETRRRIYRYFLLGRKAA